MSLHVLHLEGTKRLAENSLDVCLRLAEAMIEHLPIGSLETLVVKTDAGHPVAVVTNRRIVGLLIKQEWSGRNNDVAREVGREAFDATNAVLLLDHVELQHLDDQDDCSDKLGRSHVEWTGLCEVSLTASVCEFFGVEEVADITADALEFARRRANIQLDTTAEIILSVGVKLLVSPNANHHIAECVRNMGFSLKSGTTGIKVTHTEILGFSNG